MNAGLIAEVYGTRDIEACNLWRERQMKESDGAGEDAQAGLRLACGRRTSQGAQADPGQACPAYLRLLSSTRQLRARVLSAPYREVGGTAAFLTYSDVLSDASIRRLDWDEIDIENAIATTASCLRNMLDRIHNAQLYNSSGNSPWSA